MGHDKIAKHDTKTRRARSYDSACTPRPASHGSAMSRLTLRPLSLLPVNRSFGVFAGRLHRLVAKHAVGVRDLSASSDGGADKARRLRATGRAVLDGIGVLRRERGVFLSRRRVGARRHDVRHREVETGLSVVCCKRSNSVPQSKCRLECGDGNSRVVFPPNRRSSSCPEHGLRRKVLVDKRVLDEFDGGRGALRSWNLSRCPEVIRIPNAELRIEAEEAIHVVEVLSIACVVLTIHSRPTARLLFGIAKCPTVGNRYGDADVEHMATGKDEVMINGSPG